MWPINPDRDNSRGGFQNSDVGKTSFDFNYGPEYGVDYARFSDPPDISKDLGLKAQVEALVSRYDVYLESAVMVRNGFVFLKGSVPDDMIRNEISDTVRGITGVIEVINLITLRDKMQ